MDTACCAMASVVVGSQFPTRVALECVRSISLCISPLAYTEHDALFTSVHVEDHSCRREHAPRCLVSSCWCGCHLNVETRLTMALHAHLLRLSTSHSRKPGGSRSCFPRCSSRQHASQNRCSRRPARPSRRRVASNSDLTGSQYRVVLPRKSLKRSCFQGGLDKTNFWTCCPASPSRLTSWFLAVLLGRLQTSRVAVPGCFEVFMIKLMNCWMSASKANVSAFLHLSCWWTHLCVESHACTVLRWTLAPPPLGSRRIGLVSEGLSVATTRPTLQSAPCLINTYMYEDFSCFRRVFNPDSSVRIVTSAPSE